MPSASFAVTFGFFPPPSIRTSKNSLLPVSLLGKVRVVGGVSNVHLPPLFQSSAPAPAGFQVD